MLPTTNCGIGLYAKRINLTLLIACFASTIAVRPTAAATIPLMGTTYKVSGVNSYLANPAKPVTVKFDGTRKNIGNYDVAESIQQVTNSQGKPDTWIEFAFTRHAVPFLTPLAENEANPWRVNLADLQLPAGTRIAEFYMYFTDYSKPKPFGRRPPIGEDSFPIRNHPFLDKVSVWRNVLPPLAAGDLPPGAINALVTKFDQYYAGVHDPVRGLGIEGTMNRFHLGYRLAEVPEPATCAHLLSILAYGRLVFRRFRT